MHLLSVMYISGDFIRYTYNCSLMQISNKSITWQQLNVFGQVDLNDDQNDLLKFKLNRMGRKGNLSGFECGIIFVSDRLVGVF